MSSAFAGCVWHKVREVRRAGPWSRRRCPAAAVAPVHWSLNWTRLTRRTAAVTGSCRAILASWPSTSPTPSTSRSRRTTCGATESTSEPSSEASFPPRTPPTSAFSTTVCFSNALAHDFSTVRLSHFRHYWQQILLYRLSVSL